MTPTKEQQAQEYSDAKVKENYGSESNFEWMHIKQAFEDGYTACEQSMWRSVEEEEPPIGKLILCRDSLDVALAYYNGEGMYEAHDDGEVNMPYWMPIPSLPDTNTEKK